jgi:hypothetical protein
MSKWLLDLDKLPCRHFSRSSSGSRSMVYGYGLHGWHVLHFAYHIIKFYNIGCRRHHRRQLGCIHSGCLLAVQCFLLFNCSQFEPFPRVPPLFLSVVGVIHVSRRGEGDGSYELACKREEVTWIAVGIPSFTFGVGVEYSVDDPSLVRAGLGSLTSDDGATGSIGGIYQKSVDRCWTERPGLQLAVWFPLYFFFLFFEISLEAWFFLKRSF